MRYTSANFNPSALLCVPTAKLGSHGGAENSRGAEPVTSTQKAASMSAPPMPRPERLELLRTNPLIEITLLHRAMRLELEEEREELARLDKEAATLVMMIPIKAETSMI